MTLVFWLWLTQSIIQWICQDDDLEWLPMDHSEYNKGSQNIDDQVRQKNHSRQIKPRKRLSS